jgi:hypothetical protein
MRVMAAEQPSNAIFTGSGLAADTDGESGVGQLADQFPQNRGGFGFLHEEMFRFNRCNGLIDKQDWGN